MAVVESTVVNVYGFPQDWMPPTKKQYHGSTYLEYKVPKSLEKKLSKMIDKRLRKFRRECKCESCKEGRKRKK